MKCVGPITIAMAIVLAAACGGSKSSNGGGPSPEAGTGGDDAAPVEASSGDAGSDAEPPDNGPWPAAHYPMPLVVNGGGSIIASPKLVTVTFVGNPDRDALRTFDDTFAEGTPWWTAVTQGYGVGAATAGGHYELPDTVSNTTLNDDQSQVALFIAGAIEAGSLPQPDANTLYIVFFPASTTLVLGGGNSCATFGAYHDAAAITTDGGKLSFAYAAIPNCPQAPATDQDMATATDSVSHEVVEAATDPVNNTAWLGYNPAWFRIPGGGTVGTGEVADICERYVPVTDSNGYTLARSWSNTAALASSDPCQPELPGEIFYSVAVPTTVEIVGGPMSDGFIVVPRGTTKTVDSVIFSEAKLPNDVQITAGVRTQGSTTLSPAVATGITVSVSPTSGHNGMHVALTVQVDSTATPKDYNRISVRAALSATDHHDWPFIIRVQ